MKRRVELAQALINNPDLMILDEPFRGLDIMTRELMQEYYLKLFEETRLTTLFITSDLEEAIFLADRVLVLSGAPARIVKAVKVDLPHPRRFEVLISSRYLAIKEELMIALYGDRAVEQVVLDADSCCLCAASLGGGASADHLRLPSVLDRGVVRRDRQEQGAVEKIPSARKHREI
jgi:ABC-type taurine transport system ATPase subunit